MLIKMFSLERSSPTSTRTTIATAIALATQTKPFCNFDRRTGPTPGRGPPPEVPTTTCERLLLLTLAILKRPAGSRAGDR